MLQEKIGEKVKMDRNAGARLKVPVRKESLRDSDLSNLPTLWLQMPTEIMLAQTEALVVGSLTALMAAHEPFHLHISSA